MQKLLLKTMPINRCAPGGQWVLEKIAQLDNRAPTQDEIKGLEPESMWKAFIDPDKCIGCYKCVDVCPTSAIVGWKKSLHGVIPNDCTGCGLCIPVCPMDCIEQHSSDETLIERWERREEFKDLYDKKMKRLDHADKQDELKREKLSQMSSSREQTIKARKEAMMKWIEEL